MRRSSIAQNFKACCPDCFHDLSVSPVKPLMLTIHVYWKKPSNFRLKLNGNSTRLLIGPGVGVAPFVSYLENIEADGLKPPPVTWLFFGCRKKDEDFILKENFDEWIEKGTISRLLVSFSEEEREMKYVQHNILKYGEEIVKMLNKDDHLSVYVCGDAKNMIKD
uniref:Oxidoreductase FAD/NAD(P)-binding domain-containing protein n=1 Tax=Romanomermis culicivorax TaxID=13658 RepID=A0A915HJ52_ROMCU